MFEREIYWNKLDNLNEQSHIVVLYYKYKSRLHIKVSFSILYIVLEPDIPKPLYL